MFSYQLTGPSDVLINLIAVVFALVAGGVCAGQLYFYKVNLLLKSSLRREVLNALLISSTLPLFFYALDSNLIRYPVSDSFSLIRLFSAFFLLTLCFRCTYSISLVVANSTLTLSYIDVEILLALADETVSLGEAPALPAKLNINALKIRLRIANLKERGIVDVLSKDGGDHFTYFVTPLGWRYLNSTLERVSS